jgi:hypothetical protein
MARTREFIALAALVVIVNVEVAAWPLTATEEGEKSQVVPAGNPEQANDIV